MNVGPRRISIMIKYPYNRQRQREPSTDSSISEDLDCSYGPSANEYIVTDVNHASYILSGLNSLRENAEFCDVVLQVDGEKFNAHKIVLASFSPYFKTMFQSKYVESKQNTVHLKSIEAEMMKQLLDFAYTSTIKITKSNCQSLLSAANLLQVMKVRDAACEFLESHMDTGNCLGIYCFAESHACTDLQQKAFDFALKNFWNVAQNEEFLELTADKLIELTSSDKLEVDKEEFVFSAIKRWYNKRPEDRSHDFHKVLETVRLPLIDPYFLHDCIESFSPISENLECKNLIEEAKLYHLLPDRSVELLNNRTKQRDNANVVQVIVAVGGEDDKVVLRSVECFSPTASMWYTLASLPFAISKHGLVASGKNSLYLAGGEYPDGKVSNGFWRYDPVLDLWQEIAPMLTPRSEFGLAVLDGFIYAVGGWEGSFRLDTMERYDPNTNSWSMVQKLKMAVTSAAVVSYDRMLYVAGGAVYEEGDGINCLQRFDPRNDTWTELPPMLIARSGAATCVLDGYIYIIGGWHASTEYTNRVERFNVKTNRWEKVSSMNERRFRPGIAVISGKIYILGGEEGWDRYHDTIECYDPIKDEWNITGKLLSPRSWLGCVPLKDMSKADTIHWICGQPADEKAKLNLSEFYKTTLTSADGDCESCFDDGRVALQFEKKGPHLFRLYSPVEQEPKCQAVDVLFAEPVTIGEFKFQNYYTAYLNVLMKVENHRVWETMVDHTPLMPYPHFETGSRAYFKFHPVTEWNRVTEMRLVLRQPSPVWKRFCIENLKIFEDKEPPNAGKGYLTYLIAKTTQALKMEHKNDKYTSSTIPFHIGTYGYEIDKLIRF